MVDATQLRSPCRIERHVGSRLSVRRRDSSRECPPPSESGRGSGAGTRACCALRPFSPAPRTAQASRDEVAAKAHKFPGPGNGAGDGPPGISISTARSAACSGRRGRQPMGRGQRSRSPQPGGRLLTDCAAGSTAPPPPRTLPRTPLSVRRAGKQQRLPARPAEDATHPATCHPCSPPVPSPEAHARCGPWPIGSKPDKTADAT